MIIKKLILKNIRSYENLEIDFSEGSTLLSGEIGSGKTSVLLGLQFAIFGLQPGQKGASLLRQGEHEAYARIIFELKGKTIILERTIKKSKTGSITQDNNQITIDGETETLSTLEMKNRVIDLLNYPKEFAKKSNLLYKYTVYTPQEEMKEIIKENPETRLNTIRHIFGIDRYKRIKENAEILIQKIKETIKIKEVLMGELNLLKEKLREKTEDKIKLARETNNLNLDTENVRLEKAEKVEELKNIEEIIEKQRNEITELEKNKSVLQEKKVLEERIKKEIVRLQKKDVENIEFSYETLTNIKNLLNKHRSILEEKNQEYLEVNSKIMSLEEKKEAPLEMKNRVLHLENCPTCCQKVSEEHKEKLAKKTQYEIEEIERELEQKLILREQIIKELDKEKELIREYESDKNKAEEDRIRFENQQEVKTQIRSESYNLDRITNEIKDLSERIEKQQKDLENIDETKTKYEKMTNYLEELTVKQQEMEIRLAEKKKELEIEKRLLEQLQLEIAKKENLREQVEFLRSLQDWINEKFLAIITMTEKRVLTKIRNEFSEIFARWFNMLVEQPLSVKLDENFTPVISNQDYDIEYEFLSGGERTAVALAYRLALNQILNTLLSKIRTKDLVILDEPTDGFATEQIDKMRDIFEQLNAKQIIIVSHEQKIEGFVNNVVRVKKDFVSQVEKLD